MTNHGILQDTLQQEQNQHPFVQKKSVASLRLPYLITKSASKQTYYTIRFLVDRDRVLDAYRAYAYFRWLDDILDQNLLTKMERIAFLDQQQTLINGCYTGTYPNSKVPQENILVELIQNNYEYGTGLAFYVQNMMDVMSFDAHRCGRLISEHELTAYSQHLATAVTEALHYFIGHKDQTLQSPSRYLAVTGAHITHMLRDTFEDVALGYFNIPSEFLAVHKLDPRDIKNPAYIEWVRSRVQLARVYFKAGKDYISQIKNWRCRLAGYAYVARFEAVLNLIEVDQYRLRPDYSERKSLYSMFGMSQSILSMLLNDAIQGKS